MRVHLAGPVDLRSLRPWLSTEPVLGPGTGGRPVTQLAVGLLREGHDVEIFTLERVAEPVTLCGPGLVVHVVPRRPSGRGRDAYAVERRALAALIQRAQPEFVHAHWTYEYALAALATGAPTVVTVHDWAPAVAVRRPDPYRLVRLGMNAAALARCRTLTTVSPHMQARLRRWVRRDAELIPNAVDDELLRRRTAPPNRDAPVIVAVNEDFGRLKNVTTLLQAFADIRRRRPGAELVLAGRHYGRGGRAHHWAQRRGLDEGVSFVGSLPHDEVMGLMRRADVLAHPSLEESFGMVLVEAMAQGLPVVAGESSGAVPWVLDHGQAGALTDVRSPDAIARAVLEVLDDEGRWMQLSRRGYEEASTRFRLSTVVQRHVALYRRAFVAVS